MIAAQVGGDFHPFAIGAGAIEDGVIQLGIAVDFDTGAAIRGAIDCTAGNWPTQLNPLSAGGFTVDGSIAFVGQRAGDIHPGAVGGIPG
ncbi:Uncharacterised protein [Yersinia kristensenii]|nr:Uncharacterised protein [Yersinia kristensenii]